MRNRSHRTRQLTDLIVRVLSGMAAMVGVFALGWILYEVLARGIRAINFSFFTELPVPPGMPGGGLANAIVGTLIITIMATVLGVIIGMFAGVYLAEYGKDRPYANSVRFAANMLMGTPSIIIGVFVYALMVLPAHHFSGYAGAIALAIIMLPVIARTTEDMMNLVPNALRESALALGAPRWKVTTSVVFKSAKTGLLTGVLLAVARVSGETAPLLFTALNSPYWPKTLNGPTANLTVSIFNYAMSPYSNWQQIAWGASLLIMISVLAVNISARFLFRGEKDNAG